MKRSFAQRYIFTGRLKMETGLHIGSSWAVGQVSDSPVIRTPDGKPFIPGSSFKGAFRSTVEKLAETVGLKSCLLDRADVNSICLSPEKSELGQAFRVVRGYENRRIDSANKDASVALQKLGQVDWIGKVITEKDLMALLEIHLCDTCKLFGSPYAASQIIFADLLPPKDDTLANKMVQVRDGVAIDRDSEKAVDQLKYDYEVVAPAQTFELNITLDDPSPTDLALTCLGLSEFMSGFGYVGGHRSRGLAHCRLDELKIYELDLIVPDSAERAKRLKSYLLGQQIEEKMTLIQSPQSFFEEKIKTLPAFKEASHA